MKRILPILFLLNLVCMAAFATHYRAGEMTFRQIDALKYQVDIVTYTKTSSTQADKDTLNIHWGDNTSTKLNRLEHVDLPNDIRRNIFRGIHTYPGPTTFVAYFEDPNRDANVNNIPGSDNVPFFVQTELQINPYLGYNNSPVLLQPPIDQGTIDQVFVHNPNAYDPDGDSLSYKLVPCRGHLGEFAPGYVLPDGTPFSNSSQVFKVDPITGDLTWNTPQKIGEYNAAIEISEWRNGIRIGYVIRDLQILIGATNNKPPKLGPLYDICVEAGDTVQFNVTATDPDNDKITLDATGGPFAVNGNKATFRDTVGFGPLKSKFTWATQCQHVRTQPYQVTFSVQDQSKSPLFVPLTDLRTIRIKVIAPAVKFTNITPVGNTIKLQWSQSLCSGASGYKIYRRNGRYNLPNDSCTTGIKEGYELIQTQQGFTNTNYTDDNKGAGLVPGLEYCYRIVAIYPDGAESRASVDTCTELKKDVPVFTLASITRTHTVNGAVKLRWSKPHALDLDTVQNPPPYRIELYRYTGLSISGTGTLIKTTTGTNFKNFNDTTHTDSVTVSLNVNEVNTESTPYMYQVVFYSNGNKLGFSTASTTYLSIVPTDNALTLSWKNNVIWNNFTNYVYRKLQSAPLSSFTLIGSTVNKMYTDKGLANGVAYCYYITTKDSLTGTGFPKPISNNSQISCGTPMDNVIPCAPPNLVAKAECNNYKNVITWDNPNVSCAKDVLRYKLYFSPKENGPFAFLDSIMPSTQTTYEHQNLKVSLAGCYYITSIDSVGNESVPSNIACVDNCPNYILPNVFTPDGDGVNDDFRPIFYRFVESIEMKIYNRWGQLMFETTDIDVKWNGKNKATGVSCSDGVYFYVCKVNELHLTGVVTNELHGNIQILNSGNTRSPGSPD